MSHFFSICMIKSFFRTTRPVFSQSHLQLLLYLRRRTAGHAEITRKNWLTPGKNQPPETLSPDIPANPQGKMKHKRPAPKQASPPGSRRASGPLSCQALLRGRACAERLTRRPARNQSRLQSIPSRLIRRAAVPPAPTALFLPEGIVGAADKRTTVFAEKRPGMAFAAGQLSSSTGKAGQRFPHKAVAIFCNSFAAFCLKTFLSVFLCLQE